MVGAFRAGMQSPYRESASGLAWAYLAQILPIVPSVRVVADVHADRVVIVVDGDVDGFPGGFLHGVGCPAAACEQVDVEIAPQVELELALVDGFGKVVRAKGGHAAPPWTFWGNAGSLEPSQKRWIKG
ncbi:hypothetical protein D9M70_570310 [compost metagenome]